MDWEITLRMYRFVQWSVTIFQICNNLSYRLTGRYHVPGINQGRMQSIHGQKDHGQPETWTVCLEENLESESCILDEKMGLCALHLSTLGQEKSKEKDQKSDSTQNLPFGQTAQSACAQKNQQLLVQCRQMLHSSLLTSPRMQRVSHHSALTWSHPVPGAEQHSLLFAPACAVRTAQSLRACWSCKMCVLKIQSQLVLQDFMLQTLKTLNNNILSAFYVAPVNPEGPKALQKLYVVVAVKKLRNHSLSCLQEAEM